MVGNENGDVTTLVITIHSVNQVVWPLGGVRTETNVSDTSLISKLTKSTATLSGTQLPKMFVQVFFANQNGKTTVKERSRSAQFEKEFVFTTDSTVDDESSVGGPSPEDCLIQVYHVGYWENQLIGEYLLSVSQLESSRNQSIIQRKVALLSETKQTTGYITFSAKLLNNALQSEFSAGALQNIGEFDMKNDEGMVSDMHFARFSCLDLNVYWARGIFSNTLLHVTGTPASFELSIQYGSSVVEIKCNDAYSDPSWNNRVEIYSGSPITDDFVTITAYHVLRTARFLGICKIPVDTLLLAMHEPQWVYFYKPAFLSTDENNCFDEGGSQTARTTRDVCFKLLVAGEISDDIEKPPDSLISITPCATHTIPRGDPPEGEYSVNLCLYNLNIQTARPTALTLVFRIGSWSWKHEITSGLNLASIDITAQYEDLALQLCSLTAGLRFEILLYQNDDSTEMLTHSTSFSLQELKSGICGRTMYAPRWVSLYSEIAKETRNVDLLFYGQIMSKSIKGVMPELPKISPMEFVNATLIIHLHQLVDLPNLIAGTLPQIRVVVLFSGNSFEHTFKDTAATLNTNFCMSLECSIPRDLEFVGPLRIHFYDFSDMADSLIGSLTIPAELILFLRLRAPRWFIIDSVYAGQNLLPKCLLGGELKRPGESIVGITNPLCTLKFNDAYVYLTILGIRFYPYKRYNLNNYTVSMCYGSSSEAKNGKRGYENKELTFKSSDFFNENSHGISDNVHKLRMLSHDLSIYQSFIFFKFIDDIHPSFSRINVAPTGSNNTERILLKNAFQPTSNELKDLGLKSFEDSRCAVRYLCLSGIDKVDTSHIETPIKLHNSGFTEIEASMNQDSSVDTGDIDSAFLHNCQQVQWTCSSGSMSIGDAHLEIHSIGHVEAQNNLEFELDSDLQPYAVAPILSRVGVSRQIVIGEIKYIMATGTNAADVSATHQEMMTRYITRGVTGKRLFLRLHIHQGYGLVRRHPRTDLWGEHAGWSILLRLGRNFDSQDTMYETWLKHSICYGSPVFSASCELPIYLPYNAVIQICLVEHPDKVEHMESVTASNGFVHGRTHIDLENRWFNPEWHSIHRLKPPVEVRGLFKAGTRQNPALNIVRCGNLGVQLSILTDDELKTNPFVPLVRQTVNSLELRVAIFEVFNITYPSDSPRNLFVKATLSSSGTSGDDCQETDVHYNSHVGNGAFNWRCVYSINSSIETYVLKLQVWSSNIIQGNELLGECDILLANDIRRLFHGDCDSRVLFDRVKKTVYSDIPDRPKLTPAIMVSVELLTSTKAQASPVGKGRDAPNMNPYLEPVLDNRNVLESATQVFNFATATTTSLKRFTTWFLVIIVAFGSLTVLKQLKDLFS